MAKAPKPKPYTPSQQQPSGKVPVTKPKKSIEAAPVTGKPTRISSPNSSSAKPYTPVDGTAKPKPAPKSPAAHD